MIGRLFKIIVPVILLIVGCTDKKEKIMELKLHHPKVNIELDPQKMEDAFSMMLTTQIYRGLFRYNPTGDVEKDLAEKWVESSDRKTYRVKLKTATFSNGTKITAKNVQMTFARLFFLESAIGADIDYIEGAQEFSKTKDLSKFGVRPVSDDEVEFKLSQPSVLFLKHLAVVDCAILPLNSYKDDLDKTPSGAFSGPYKVVATEPGKHKFEKWRKDSYDSPNPPVVLSFFETDEKSADLASNGLTDSLDKDFVSKEDAEKLLSKGWGRVPTELTGETFIILNPKFIRAEIRKYLYEKTDVNGLVKKLNDGQFRPSYGLIPIGFNGVMAAKDIESIKPSNPDYKGKKIAFELDYDPAYQDEKETAEFLRDNWNSDLIEVRLNPLKKREKIRRIFAKESQAVLGRKGMDYPDGFSILTYFKGKYSANYFFVDDPAIDKALSQSILDFDEQSRGDRYRSIQLQILKHYTVIPLFFGSDASGLWSGNVKNVPSHPMGYHTMPFESVEMRK